MIGDPITVVSGGEADPTTENDQVEQLRGPTSEHWLEFRKVPASVGEDGVVLIVMAGLPGSGKSALAGVLARAMRCALLSVDPIEAAIWRAGVARDQPTGIAAYVVAEDLAREQLRLNNDVIVDAVNDAEPARAQWHSLALQVEEPLTFVEVFCGDEDEHRRRLKGRQRAITGFPEPTWQSVLARRESFANWDQPRLRVDSMRPVEVNAKEVLQYLESLRPQDNAS